MPHRIDIDSISRNLFILRHLAAGSHSVCQKFRIDRLNEEDKPLGWNYYLGWLKVIVSQMLIGTAINVRITQDFLKADSEDDTDLESIEAAINTSHIIGHFIPNRNPMSLREACNKIIHANEVKLVWLDERDEKGAYEFWNGTVNLDGCKWQEPWSCQLYVPVFCTALDSYLLEIEDKVDWYHVYKYDE